MSEITYHPAAATDELDDEELKVVFVDGTEIVLYNLEGEYFATDGICTHENIGLADGFVDDGKIECPLHSACFDIRTGKALQAPATVDLKIYPVKIDGDQVLIGVERD